MEWSADKVLDSCYTKACIARTNQTDNNWIRVDLQNVYKIAAIIIQEPTLENCKR